MKSLEQCKVLVTPTSFKSVLGRSIPENRIGSKKTKQVRLVDIEQVFQLIARDFGDSFRHGSIGVNVGIFFASLVGHPKQVVEFGRLIT